VTDDGIARRTGLYPKQLLRLSWAVAAEPGYEDGRETVVFRCAEQSCRCGGEGQLQLPDRFTVGALVHAIARHRIEYGS